MTTDGKVGRQQLTRALGRLGLKVYAGRLQEEYLTRLKDWRTASRTYREMQDDAVIGTLLDAVKLPLLAADFDVIPAGDTPGDEAAAEFVWDNMEGLHRQTWRSHVRDMLEAVDFGFSLGEIVMEKRNDGRMWLKNIEPRGQETLERWVFNDEDPDVLEGWIQRTDLGFRSPVIPIDKMVHVTWQGRKGSPQGKPLMRSLFRPWMFVKNLENFESIGIERDVGGMPMVEFPDPDKWHGPVATDDLKTIFEDALKGLRMDEAAWLLAPPGSTIKPYASGSKLYNVRETIVAKQKEILMRFFAQFLMLGMEQVGTQALVKGSQDFFMLSLQAVQQELLEAWQGQLVPLLLGLNSFPGMTGEPTITWNDPGTENVPAFVQAYVQAAQANLLTVLREDEEHLRALMDLPDLPEGEGEGSREMPEPEFVPFKEALR